MRIRSHLLGPVLTALVIAACGGADSEPEESTSTFATIAIASTSTTEATNTTTPSTTSSTEAATTTTAMEARSLTDLEGGTANGVGWLAEPGVYEFELEGRTVRIDLAKPFTFVPTGPILTLAPADIPDTGFQINLFSLTGWAGVIPAEQTGIHPPHDPTVPEFTQPIPDSLADWIDTVPQMVSQPGPNYAGEGYSAMSWDISIDPTAGETFACDYGDCVGVLAHEDAGVFVMGDDFGFRLWQFEGAGDLLGFGQAPLDGLEQAEAFYQMVLDGLSISE